MARQWELIFVPSIVERIYRQVLERGVDNIGLVGWGCELTQGQGSVRDVVRAIALSPEYASRFIIPFSLPQQIEFCYRHFLARASDPQGLQFWIQQAQQQGIDSVIQGIIESAEYTQKFGDDGVPG